MAMLTIHNLIYSQIKQITNSGRRQHGAENAVGLLFWKKKWLEGIQRGFLSERIGKVILCRGAEDRWEQAVESLHKGGIVLQWKVFIRGA